MATASIRAESACNNPIALPDQHILDAWKTRQAALQRIEAAGSFFDAETHSPEDTALFDQADETIIRATALTPQGALAQAWVALAYAQDSFSERNRQQNAFIRRADLPGLLAEGDYLDWELRTLISVIRSLRSMIGED